MADSLPARASPEPGATGALIAGVASLATALVILTWHGAEIAAKSHPVDFAVFFVLTAGLMLLAVDIYGKGSISVSGVTLLATGFTFGVGAGILAGIFAAGVHAVRRRSKPHKALFNAATFAVAAAAGVAVYRSLPHSHSPIVEVAPAVAGGATFWAVNIGLLTLVMSVSQGRSVRITWNEHFRWLTLHYLAFGPLAIACTIAYQKVGLVGLLAFALPPALLIVSVQQYIEKTRASVAEIERANDELRRSNADLRDLFEFATGLAAQTHDSKQLAGYARTALQRLTGAKVDVSVGEEMPSEATPLASAGRVVGGLQIEGGDVERWARLGDAIVPQLATALESTTLADEVRKTHLETIAALSRSMEAKDNYTGGHTERVSDIAIGLGKRLGYSGADLDAIEIGALMHDIGKIGIPESILHKPGPLDNDEWIVMKRHPVISELILKEIDLSPIVTQIARSSHERMDGQGYPDGLTGDEIPMPARIVLVADAFDALTTDRPYRRARRPKAALDEIVANSGDQFCPKVVEALKQMYVEEPATLGEVALSVVASA
jgi:HD-GYP domain-containing protein (c-di-GMP phosphodiesterase class II)